VAISERSAGEVTKSMTTIGHIFIPLDRAHDGTVPTDDDQTHFERPVPLALWELFQQCLSRHLSELTEGQIDRDEMFWFDAAHVPMGGVTSRFRHGWPSRSGRRRTSGGARVQMRGEAP
jgi:hypothetical protein